MEDPTSLNLPKGLSAATALKDAVLQSLIDNVDHIKNQLFKDAILAVKDENQSVLSFLMSIKYRLMTDRRGSSLDATGSGAWPFQVRGVICLVNSDNGRVSRRTARARSSSRRTRIDVTRSLTH